MTDPTPDVPTLRRLLADGLCLCSSASTDWDGVADLLDRLEAAEGAVARVEALADEWDACDEHGNPLREGSFGEAADDLRAALAEVTP